MKTNNQKELICLSSRVGLRLLPFVFDEILNNKFNEYLSPLLLHSLRVVLSSVVIAATGERLAIHTSREAFQNKRLLEHGSAAATFEVLSHSMNNKRINIDNILHSGVAYSQVFRTAYETDRFACEKVRQLADAYLLPLWHGKSFPTHTKRLLRASQARYLPKEWAFWRDWYQGFLDGKPMDWELQRRVALIPDPVWEAGPETVAEEIERIRAEYLAEKAPLAERVEFNPETAKFYTIPLDVAKPDLLGATLSQVEDALEDVLASPSNGLHDNAREVRVLRRVFTKYGNDPQQIEMSFNNVYRGLARQILSKELPESEENLALQDALQEGAQGIRATHPEVAENRKILNEQAIRELPAGAVELLEDAQPLLVAISEERLADDWAEDIPQLINDATLPLPSGAPPLPGADEATRIFSRVSKMRVLYDKLVSNGAEMFDSKTFKTVRLGLTVGGLLSALVGLGLQLFGIL